LVLGHEHKDRGGEARDKRPPYGGPNTKKKRGSLGVREGGGSFLGTNQRVNA